MKHRDETEVLVVGAGPVGMTCALLLAKQGIEVKVIDKAERTTARSYACALHPSSLERLARMGLLDAVLERGRRIDTVAFYEGDERRADLKLSTLPVQFPFVLALSQTALEELLESRLHTEAGVKIHWNHRFTDFEKEGNTVTATIDQLGETSKGYIVPEWEWVVDKSWETQAAFVVGADGPKSHVRRCLGLEMERLGPAESFMVYELPSEEDYKNEMRVVLTDQTTNVLWPLPGDRCRWSFQVPPEAMDTEFPGKDIWSLKEEHPAEDHETVVQLRCLVQDRAPWFGNKIRQVDWTAEVHFEHQLAKSFGRGHCWMAGDAAHQTGPVAMQSMNMGLIEAEALANILVKILRHKESWELLNAYDRDRQGEWRRLLTSAPVCLSGREVDPWIQKRASRLPACLPASGQDREALLRQLGLALP
jgi:2-polyprenyl-6-methoxyphenol hydroxylase-like FAD-dependent oxidoreductase